MAPWPDRVQSNDGQLTGDVDGLRRFEDTIPLFTRPREARRENVRNIVVPWNREEGETDALEQFASALELWPAAAVREVACDYEDLRRQLRYQFAQSGDWFGRGTVSEMEIRDVENPSVHGRETIATSLIRSRGADHLLTQARPCPTRTPHGPPGSSHERVARARRL